jgi:hypothetical protein
MAFESRPQQSVNATIVRAVLERLKRSVLCDRCRVRVAHRFVRSGADYRALCPGCVEPHERDRRERQRLQDALTKGEARVLADELKRYEREVAEDAARLKRGKHAVR